MNELDLLSTLRDEVPLLSPSRAVDDIVLAAIAQAAPTTSSRARRHGVRAVHGQRRVAALAGTAVLAAGVAAALVLAIGAAPAGQQVIAWSGRPMAPVQLSYPTLGQARTEAQLVDYATRAATMAPGRAPMPHEWVFVKTETALSSAGGGGFLFGPPDERSVGLSWVRVDWREVATLTATIPADLSPSAVVRGELSISPAGGGTVCGWRSISYSYLSSLPATPARLAAIIRASNLPDLPCYLPGPANVIVFTSIARLLKSQAEGAWIPPRLAATMYRILQRLPGVRFDAGVDLAGRTGIGLYLVIDGWYKDELVINPANYQFMGAETVATSGHTSVATDGIRHIKAGQVLGWDALLESAIVQRPGQLP